MAEKQDLDNNPKQRIKNIEQILPKIEQKLLGRENEKAEYEDIRTQISTLKIEYENLDKNTIEIRNKTSLLNKRAVKLYLGIEPSPFVRFFKRIQQIWRTSKTLFFIQLILVAMLIAVSALFGNNDLQTLLLESGFALILIIVFIRLPKYRFFTGFAIFAMVLFIYVNYSPESLRWTLISLGITLVAFGLSLHAFQSGESLEQRIGKIENIEKKLDEVLNRLPDPRNERDDRQESQKKGD